MKNSIFFIVLFSLSFSCKKDESSVTRFALTSKDGLINHDSISYALINYSDVNELQDSLDLMNPEVFSHSIKVVEPFSLTLIDGHFYVLKKFDLYDKSDKLKYYIPFRSQVDYKDGITLPFSFKAMSRTLALSVTKKN